MTFRAFALDALFVRVDLDLDVYMYTSDADVQRLMSPNNLSFLEIDVDAFVVVSNTVM